MTANGDDDNAMRERMTALAKDIGLKCPVTSRAMLARKFLLPKYRQGDYYDQDEINRISLMMLMLPSLPDFQSDDVVQSQLLNLFQSCERRYAAPVADNDAANNR